MAMRRFSGRGRSASVQRPGVAARAPEDDTAERVGFDFGDGEPFLYQLFGQFAVGREKEVEGRAVADLGVKLPGRTVADFDAVGGAGFAEQADDFVHREAQVGGRGDTNLSGMQWRRDEQEGEGDETEEGHDCAFYTTGGTKGKAGRRRQAGHSRACIAR